MNFSDLGYVLLIGLGSMKIIELYKEVMIRVRVWHQSAWWKSALTILVCAVFSFTLPSRPGRIEVLITLGSAGMAALAHAVDTALRHYRDELASQVLARNQVARNRMRR